MKLTDRVNVIKGVGEKTTALFAKLHIETIKDFITWYPRNYLSYDEPKNIGEAAVGERVAVLGRIHSRIEIKKVRSLTLVSCTIKDYTGSMKLVWYNCPFLKQVFHVGGTFVFVGTISVRNNQKQIEHPEYYAMSNYVELQSSLQSIYPLTEGLSNKTLIKCMYAVKPLMEELTEYLPLDLDKQYHLMPYQEAVKEIHFPKDYEMLLKARNRLVFDEFFIFLTAMHRIKQKTMQAKNQYQIPMCDEVECLKESLPFSLTDGQLKAIDDIANDFMKDTIMNRLVQGDVGSGKTIVAVIALLMSVKANYQGAMMVPTEILALQHYESILKILEPFGINIALLIGSTPLKEKRKIYEALADGTLDIVVGTHAVIQEKVNFLKLALVITDEQHRFGVLQRENLSRKGSEPHVLVMSATPIPRTLAIIMYGDLDISMIRELPKERLPIKNCVVGTAYRPTAYRFMEAEIKKGHQVYVICPMVEESENTKAENVVVYADTLKEAFHQTIRIQYLHGKMKSDEKTQIMERFQKGDIDILVSTTVVEVGINNPNATVMMIENAEKFGLAQLHQLRGRVGRGEAQSYCIMVYTSDKQEVKERLEILNQSNDGFFIANEDLKLRGPGDFFGIRQSGELLFRLGDIYQNAEILKMANDAVLHLQNIEYPLENIKHPGLEKNMNALSL